MLEIVSDTHSPMRSDDLSEFEPDAVFVMMNPGSSRPLVEVDNRVRARSMHRLAMSLVPTRPDTTQYQVMRVMHFKGWHHVRVINLSDLRCAKSLDFMNQFRCLERECNFDSHSLFSKTRRQELLRKLPEGKATPLVLAWGMHDLLAPLIKRCMEVIDGKYRMVGLLKSGTTDRYRHPLPSLHQAQRDWLDQMMGELQRE